MLTTRHTMNLYTLCLTLTIGSTSCHGSALPPLAQPYTWVKFNTLEEVTHPLVLEVLNKFTPKSLNYIHEDPQKNCNFFIEGSHFLLIDRNLGGPIHFLQTQKDYEAPFLAAHLPITGFQLKSYEPGHVWINHIQQGHCTACLRMELLTPAALKQRMAQEDDEKSDSMLAMPPAIRPQSSPPPQLKQIKSNLTAPTMPDPANPPKALSPKLETPQQRYHALVACYQHDGAFPAGIFQQPHIGKCIEHHLLIHPQVPLPLNQVYVAQEDLKNQQCIQHTLYRRIPIHIAGLIEQTNFHPWLKALTGYELTDLPYTSPLRLAIAGKVPIFSYQKVSLKPTGWCYMLHTYGLNFEGTTTHDYKNCLNVQGRLNDKGVLEIEKMWRIIFGGACHSTGTEACIIRITPIGQGFFNNCYRDKEGLNQYYIDRLVCVAKNFPQTTIQVMGERNNIFIRGLHAIKNHLPNNITLFDQDRGLLLEDPTVKFGDPLTIDGKPLVIVNNWDDKSFIGNGQCGDYSLDGTLVAAIYNHHLPLFANQCYPNASILQNPVIDLRLRDPKNYVAIPQFPK